MGKRVVKRERKWVKIKRVGREKRVYLKLSRSARSSASSASCTARAAPASP